jgi:hypothetical protein
MGTMLRSDIRLLMLVDGTGAEDSSIKRLSPPAPFLTLATTCNPMCNLFKVQLVLVHLVHIALEV